MLLDARRGDRRARTVLRRDARCIWAAAENHADAVRVLARARRRRERPVGAAQVFARRRNGQSMLPLGSWTPLMYAARENALDAGTALVAPAPTSMRDPDGATALVIAIINAHYELRRSSSTPAPTPTSWTRRPAWAPLYAAVDMHRLAIGHGRPQPAPRRHARRALDIVRQLLEHRRRPERGLKKPMLQRQHTVGDARSARARRRSCAPPSRATSR